MLVENLEETSIKGHRLLYDYMTSKNVTIHKFIIPKEVTLSCKSVYSKCRAVIESARKSVLMNALALSLECENKQDPVEIVELVKSNLFRKTAIERENTISELKQAITKSENDLKNV